MVARLRWAGAHNNYSKRLRSRYCAVEATEKHEASRGLSATAEIHVTLTQIFMGGLVVMTDFRDGGHYPTTCHDVVHADRTCNTTVTLIPDTLLVIIMYDVHRHQKTTCFR